MLNGINCSLTVYVHSYSALNVSAMAYVNKTNDTILNHTRMFRTDPELHLVSHGTVCRQDSNHITSQLYPAQSDCFM